MNDKSNPEDLHLFRSIFEKVSDAVYIIDPDSSAILEVNEAGCRDLGMNRAQVLNQSVLSLNRDVTGTAQWQEISEAIRQAGDFLFVGRHCRRDGSEFPVEVRTSYCCHGDTAYFVSIARDISLRQKLEEQLRDKEYIQAFTLNEASDGLWDWDLRNNSLYLSPQWYRMMGYGPHEVSPELNTWKSAVHPDDIDRVISLLDNHLNGQTDRYEAKYRLRNRNGDYLWVHDRGKVMERDEQDQPVRVVGMVLDVTKAKQLEEKLRHRSQRDELTGLNNRRTGYDMFSRYLRLSIRRGTPLSIAMLDLDHFKKINDSLGHLTGDDVICHFAETVSNSIRNTDLFFRWGGEEFLLICPDTSLEAMESLVACLIKQISTTPLTTIEDPHIRITASAGISGYPPHGDSIEELVKSADKAMYQAKANGRNCACTAPPGDD